MPVTFEANSSSSERTGTVTFSNSEYGYEMKLTIRQYPSGVVFSEDFEWLDPWALAGDNNGKPAGQTVETDDLKAYCPQLPTSKVDGVSTLQALEAKGYEMLTSVFISRRIILNSARQDITEGSSFQPQQVAPT